jgi:hypothetical protein
LARSDETGDTFKAQDPARLVCIACFVPSDGRDAAVELDRDSAAPGMFFTAARLEGQLFRNKSS